MMSWVRVFFVLRELLNGVLNFPWKSLSAHYLPQCIEIDVYCNFLNGTYIVYTHIYKHRYIHIWIYMFLFQYIDNPEIARTSVATLVAINCLPTDPYHPLKCVQWVVLLGGALGRMFGGSPQFLFVFYRPDRRENVRS